MSDAPLTHILNNSAYQMVVSEISTQEKAYIIVTQAEKMEQVQEILRSAVPELCAMGAKHIYITSKRPAIALPEGRFTVDNMNFLYESAIRRMRLDSMRTAWPERIPGIMLLPLTPALAKDFLEIYNRCFADVPNSVTYTLDDIARILHAPSFEGGVINCGGKLAGTYEISYEEEVPEISTFCMDEAFRKRGLGKQALRVVLYKLEQKGFDKARLLVSSANTAAINLYESLGFQMGDVVSAWYHYEA